MKKILLLFLSWSIFFSLPTLIHAQSSLPSDFNQDGIVDLTDYSILIHNFLKSEHFCTKGWNIAEISGDCHVDLVDYSIFVHNFLKTSPIPQKKTTLVFINDDDYQVLIPTLTDFKNDVEGRLPVKIKFLPIFDLRHKTADYVRNTLISECGTISVSDACSNIEGAIFVGDVPYALYDQPFDANHTAPFVFFYQDLDSTFEQNANGHYFKYASYGVHEGPEIYVSWIKPIVGSLNSPVDQLRLYFEKHHRFFTHQVVPNQTFLAAIHCPINGPADEFFYSQMIEKYGRAHTTEIYPSTICDDLQPLKSQLLTALSQMPEVAYLHSHGDERTIWNLKSNDFRLLSAQPLMIESWGCRNGSWLFNEDSSTALQFINGKDLGLAYVAKLDNEDLNIVNNPTSELNIFISSQTHTFNYWVQGKYLGKALLTQMQDYSNYNYFDYPYSQSHNLYRESGPLQRVLIGSPFVYPQSSYLIQ